VKTLKVYLVEDSAVIRASLIATLEELAAIKVLACAEDELGAVQWITDPAHVFDLVIVDIQLRSGSGLGVLRACLTLTKPHKVVVLSNYATADMVRICLGLGADRVFDKSNEIDALIAYCNDLAGAAPDEQAIVALPQPS
jgi:DNA-binding NarL/FixJ family response regulator